MRSSTNIEITAPKLTEKQQHEMFEAVCSVSPKWLKEEYFSSYDIGDSTRYYMDESGVEYEEAEEIIDAFIHDFARQNLRDKEFDVTVRYEQMNADGSTIWKVVCKDNVCTYITDSEIIDELMCPNCFEPFDVDFDWPDGDFEGDDEDYDMENEPECKLVCPECGEEYIKCGNYLRYITYEPLR